MNDDWRSPSSWRPGIRGPGGATHDAASDVHTEEIPAVRPAQLDPGPTRPPASRPGRRGPADGGASAAADRRAFHRRSRRRNRRVLLVLGALTLPVVLAVGWFAYELRPGSNGKPVLVDLRHQTSASDVADTLASKGIVDSPLAFRLWATISGAGPFQPGHYTLHQGMGIRNAIHALDQGPPRSPDLTLLVPPGLTVAQIAQRVGTLRGHTAAGFLQVANSGTIRSKYEPAGVNSLEGLLFPDTYFIGAHWSDKQIVQLLVNQFDKVADQAGLASAQGVNAYQAIVIASLIQTEDKVPDDAPLISEVIHNRLTKKMPLQIDSTLCYAKGGCPPVPTEADKAVASSYNTYKITGLPPTPIASITEANLKAALNPAAGTYLYYVIADASGRHAFASTLQEHERNVATARRKGLL
jgi:UPF0755 protein